MCNTCNSSGFSNGRCGYSTASTNNGCGYSTTSTNNGCGCGCNACCNCLFNLLYGNSCCSNSCYNPCYQRICRDCNGNIRVSNSNGCGYSTASTNNGCNGGWNTWNNGWNGNSGHSGCGCENGNSRSGDIHFITVCGNSGNNGNGRRCRYFEGDTTATSDSGDDYYARQYGLNGRSGRSSCGCGFNG